MATAQTSTSRASYSFCSNCSGAMYGSEPQRPLERCVVFSQHMRKTSDTPKSVILTMPCASMSRFSGCGVSGSCEPCPAHLDVAVRNAHRVEVSDAEDDLLEVRVDLGLAHLTALDRRVQVAAAAKISHGILRLPTHGQYSMTSHQCEFSSWTRSTVSTT